MNLNILLETMTKAGLSNAAGAVLRTTFYSSPIFYSHLTIPAGLYNMRTPKLSLLSHERTCSQCISAKAPKEFPNFE